MAFLLSISLTTPFCYPAAQFQGTYTRRLTSGRLINPVTSRTGKMRLHKYSGGGVISSKGSRNCEAYAAIGRCFEPVLGHFGVCCSVHVLISGFWMGPDVEDGWGFVEAFVHRIY